MTLRRDFEPAPGLAAGGLGIVLRAAALEGGERQGIRRQRLREALMHVLLQRLGVRASGATRQQEQQNDQGAHVSLR
jgi:hypothetical protein